MYPRRNEGDTHHRSKFSVIWNKGNSKEKKHPLCKPEGYDPSSLITHRQLEQLRLYEGWCAFCHNEYTKNLLCVLEEMSRQIYGPNATIPNRFLGLFLLDHKDIKSLVARRAKNKNTPLPYLLRLV